MAENTDHSLTTLQTLTGYLKHPENIQFSDEKNIESLIERFPYAQTLHALQAKCYNESAEFDNYLSKAAMYAPDRNTLYHIIYKPDVLSVNRLENAGSIEEPVVPTGDIQNNISSLENPEEHPDPADQATRALDTTSDAEAETTGESFLPIEEETESLTEDLDQEIVNTEEEFTMISITTAGGSGWDSEIETIIPDLENEQSSDSEEDTPLVQSRPETADKPSDETEKQIISNIASADFFRFEEKIDNRITAHQNSERRVVNEQQNADKQGVSKYDDDTMPYTFRWWLHKTRKEHSDTYQPYVNFKLDTTQQIKKETPPVLNQQIIENIFHLQSPLDDLTEKSKPQTVEFTLKRKDEQIIERFIREEPQIRPPGPEKLNTENKARKSSEDSYDMVSETLAQVYIEQMLFNKAIDTYKKLSLKFPEKSAYFADQIRKLESPN